MDVILRKAGDYSFFFLIIISIYVYRFYLVAKSCEKILCVPQILDVKAARNVDKANCKILQFNLASFFSLQRVNCFTQVFYIFGNLFYC